MMTSSEAVALNAALDDEEIDHDADQDDDEHESGDGRAHGGIADLELVAEEGAVEERAHDVGGEIRSRERSLHRIDEVEGVEVADEGKDRNETDGRQDQG